VIILPKTLINIKEDILMVARELLFEEGYEKLNIRSIAAKCGIASGTLYNYYKSKQEIVGEILKNEWAMMLRRVDQGAKSDSSLMYKFEMIFTELRDLLNNVHGIWFDTSNLNMNKDELSSMKCHKKVLLKSLSEKIFYIIKDSGENKDYEFLADVICRLLILYAYEGEVEFKKLYGAIEAMLR
jgi:AcrR family transcriptional regulator